MPIYAQVNVTIVFIQNTLELIKHTSSVDVKKMRDKSEIWFSFRKWLCALMMKYYYAVFRKKVIMFMHYGGNNMHDAI